MKSNHKEREGEGDRKGREEVRDISQSHVHMSHLLITLLSDEYPALFNVYPACFGHHIVLTSSSNFNIQKEINVSLCVSTVRSFTCSFFLGVWCSRWSSFKLLIMKKMYGICSD